MNLNSGGRVKRPSGRPPVTEQAGAARDHHDGQRDDEVVQADAGDEEPHDRADAGAGERSRCAEAIHGSMPLQEQPARRSPSRSAVTEPTDRSMPPEISRIVMPTTTMPSTAKAMAMARMFTQVRK